MVAIYLLSLEDYRFFKKKSVWFHFLKYKTHLLNLNLFPPSRYVGFERFINITKGLCSFYFCVLPSLVKVLLTAQLKMRVQSQTLFIVCFLAPEEPQYNLTLS